MIKRIAFKTIELAASSLLLAIFFNAIELGMIYADARRQQRNDRIRSSQSR
jgi:hypothetical protein